MLNGTANFEKFHTFSRWVAWCSESWGSSWYWFYFKVCLIWFNALYTFVCCPHDYRFSIVIITCAIKSGRDIFLNTHNVICVVPKLNSVLHWATTCVRYLWLPLNATSAITFISASILGKTNIFNFIWND